MVVKKHKKRRNFTEVFFHLCIVYFFTFMSWAVAEGGQNFLDPPWNIVFFFSRFFLDIDVIVFGIFFLIYFKYIHYFKAPQVVIAVMWSLAVLEVIAWFIFQNAEWFIYFLNWMLSSFIAAIMVMMMGIRYEK